MTMTNINDYIGLKTTLSGQILADALMADIETTITDILTLKSTIASTYAAQNYLDDGEAVSTADRIKWILQVRYAIDEDAQLNAIIQSGISKAEADLNSDDGTGASSLRTRKEDFKTLLFSCMSSIKLAFFSTMVNNL